MDNYVGGSDSGGAKDLITGDRHSHSGFYICIGICNKQEILEEVEDFIKIVSEKNSYAILNNCNQTSPKSYEYGGIQWHILF